MFFFIMIRRPPRSTLFLHDALPIFNVNLAGDDLDAARGVARAVRERDGGFRGVRALGLRDLKSTRLNSSHMSISYAVFCLKNKKISSLTPMAFISMCL